ncbi:MAG: hypothetical protein MZV70_42975 [Desulfobacterales bacterium]|nr:hypothetical protein [Desulfobacterales bacterium]
MRITLHARHRAGRRAGRFVRTPARPSSAGESTSPRRKARSRPSARCSARPRTVGRPSTTGPARPTAAWRASPTGCCSASRA